MNRWPNEIGVCSWSLRPASPADLFDALGRLGLHAIQLHLDPIADGSWDAGEVLRLADQNEIRIASGMMTCHGEDYTSLESIRRTGGLTPDSTWQENLARARAVSEVAHRLGVPLVTLHAGHLPADLNSLEARTMLARLSEIDDVLGAARLGLETGQETASTLTAYLDELPGVRVNFDPANMILYAMGDPTEAIECLGPRIAQLHIKDALPTSDPGTWGREVPVGQGAVKWPEFLQAARSVCPAAAMMIEREAGEDRERDIALAAEVIADAAAGVAASQPERES